MEHKENFKHHIKHKRKEIGIFVIGILVVLALFFAGCMKQVPNPDAIPSQAQQPAAAQETAPEEAAVTETPVTPEEPAAEEQPLPGDQVTMEEKLVDQSAERETIGNRVNEEYVEETSVRSLEGTEATVLINTDKTLSESVLLVGKGTTLTWKNQDEQPHILLVEEDETIILRGERMENGDTWSYKFDEEGDFVVRDMFSGTIRMSVKVS